MPELSASEIDAIVANDEARWTEDDDNTVDPLEFWEELPYKDTAFIPMLGKIQYVEGTQAHEDLLDYNGSYTTWNIWVVFKTEDGRYFRKSGESDSWDSKGYYLPLEEVESVKKTISVWETKNDY